METSRAVFMVNSLKNRQIPGFKEVLIKSGAHIVQSIISSECMD